MSQQTPDVESSHRGIAERFVDGRSWAAEPTLSPDGSHVAYVVATTDLGSNTTRT